MDERTARAFQWLKGLCDIEFGTPDGEAMEKIHAYVLSERRITESKQAPTICFHPKEKK